MKKRLFIADLHIHSRFSRATSKDCSPESLELWARRKGIDLVGTGDFTHPMWRKELEEKLTPAEEGLYVLKEEYRIRDGITDDGRKPRFVLSGEISSIYKKKDKVRKIHNLILLPSLEAAHQLSCKLETIGNIHSDGRPILGLDSRDLLEITIEICPNAIFIPAHIWTPHFSLFGAFSGFDKIEDCFEDLTPYIHAVETGLSSDPEMNWRLSALDHYQLISNSDAHSPSKLGREATLLQTELSYEGLEQAIQTGEGLYGTIEFFPEEGKYFLDGHRKCGLSLTPAKTREFNGICPVCGKKITIGVFHRVEELADREEGFVLPNAKAFESLVPLPEVIASSMGCAVTNKKVNATYEQMLKNLGAEFAILREIPLEDIKHCTGSFIEEGIRRLRTGKVERIAGFDGQYGIIQVLKKEEVQNVYGQVSLFDSMLVEQTAAAQEETIKSQNNTESFKDNANDDTDKKKKKNKKNKKISLNPEQWEAVKAQEEIICVIAGPGTGKTKTLIEKIASVISENQVPPEQVMAVTFTNKAAREMRERLEKRLKGKKAIQGIHIGTFHSLCYEILSKEEGEFLVAETYQTNLIVKHIIEKRSLTISSKKLIQEISRYKNKLPLQNQWDEVLWNQVLEEYQYELEKLGMVDFDDLLEKTLKYCREGYNNPQYLFVDEMQDLNEIQYELIKEWNKGGKSLFVIGDPDQSIYGFRGSSSKYFEQLAKDFKTVKKIRLKENYRSTPEIVHCGLSALKRQKDSLIPQQKSGEQVHLITTENSFEEAVFIAKEINRMTGGMDMLDVQTVDREQKKLKSFDEIAVLYRTHQQARVLELCLKKESIPYKIVGRDDFLEEETVKAAISFFRFLIQPQDVLSLSVYLREIEGYTEEDNQVCIKLVKQINIVKWTEKILASLEAELQKVGIMQQWTEKIRYFYPKIKKERPQSLIEEWSQKNGLEEKEELRKLECMAVFYKDMKAFLQNLLFGQEGDIERNAKKQYDSGVVSLMTFHGAKGLEFPVVFLCGLKKGILPLEYGKEIDIEEERRLFYVGITRAKEELILLAGQEPSVFLEELEGEELKVSKGRKKKEKNELEGEQLSLFDL